MEKRGASSMLGQSRGQFYLVAAIIITAIVLGIVVMVNFSDRQEYSDLGSLRDEMRIEAANAIGYSINNGETSAAIDNRMQDFTQEYIDLESRDKDLYFVFGTQDSLTIKGYQKDIHSILLDGNAIISDSGAFIETIDPISDTIVLQIDDDSHAFLLNDWQNFYFVLSKDIEGGDYVVEG